MKKNIVDKVLSALKSWSKYGSLMDMIEKMDKPSVVFSLTINEHLTVYIDSDPGSVVYWGDGSIDRVGPNRCISHRCVNKSEYIIKIFGVKRFLIYPMGLNKYYSKNGSFMITWISSTCTRMTIRPSILFDN